MKCSNTKKPKLLSSKVRSVILITTKTDIFIMCSVSVYLFVTCTHQRKGKHGVLLLPENAMKCRKALLSEEELLVRKEGDQVCKASKRACTEGSALQCCSLSMGLGDDDKVDHLEM